MSAYLSVDHLVGLEILWATIVRIHDSLGRGLHFLAMGNISPGCLLTYIPSKTIPDQAP